ncbi:MAG: thiaminase II [Bacteroidota bacterium]|nr:thiaminase II [Bacteroidota bacterium]
MSNWYQQINRSTESILAKIQNQPFIKELMQGTLPKDVFQFYINQDALYLAQYKKVLALVGIKCRDENETQFFLDAATGIIHVENALHQHFVNADSFTTIASPTCELYTSYLSRIAHEKSITVSIAAVLPCFTIYKQIGDYIIENQTNKDNNPYQEWINTYGGEEFAASVEQAINIANKYAQTANQEELEMMNQAFLKASQLEWMFWDSAYRKEQWEI